MTFEMAERLEEEEKFEEAYEEYKKVAQNNAGLDLLQRLAHLASMLGKTEEAQNYYNRILEKDATNEMAYEQLMDLYINTDKYKYYISRGNLHNIQHKLSHAINDYKKALNHAQENQEITTTRFVLATLYEQTGKDSQAIDEYLRILDTEQQNDEVYLRLAKLYEKEDIISSAIEILERARDNEFETEKVKEALANLYLKSSNPELAGQLTGDPLTKARSLMDEGKEDEAFALLEKVKADYKKSSKYYSLVAQYHYQKQNLDEALESVAEFDKLDKNSPLTYQMRALIYEEKEDEFNAHYNWAKYNIIRGNKDVALSEYMMSYQDNDQDTQLTLTIAELLDEMKDKNHAAEYYERLVKLDPKNKKAMERLFEFRESIGDYHEACKYLEMIHELDPRNARTLKNLGRIYEKLKKKDLALEFYKKYLESSAVAQDEEEIKKKVAKLENTTLQPEVDDEGLIGKIMRLFSK